MNRRALVLGTTFQGEKFEQRVEEIISPFVGLTTIKRIWCVNRDVHEDSQSAYTVVAFDRQSDAEMVRQPDCQSRTLYRGILRRANATEILESEVETDSIFLHRL